MYLLTDRDRAKNYIALMHVDINARKRKLESDWMKLEYEFMGKLPSNEFYMIENPSISEWQDNHLKSNWVSIQEDYFRSPEKSVISFNPDGHDYKYHSYNDLINDISRWFDTKKKLWQWEQQLNLLSKHETNLDLLDEDGVSYNEALFILLGFNTSLLNSQKYPSLFYFTMLNFDQTKVSNSYVENWLFDHSDEVKKLSRVAQFQYKVIDTKALITWAKNKGLLIELGERTLQSNTGSIIHKVLLKSKCIHNCKQDEIWLWKKTDILLAYFILLLSDSGVIPLENPWKTMEPYILQKGKARLSKNRDRLKSTYPEGYKGIDKLVKEIKMRTQGIVHNMPTD